jgi:hypothetical protein
MEFMMQTLPITTHARIENENHSFGQKPSAAQLSHKDLGGTHHHPSKMKGQEKRGRRSFLLHQEIAARADHKQVSIKPW